MISLGFSVGKKQWGAGSAINTSKIGQHKLLQTYLLEFGNSFNNKTSMGPPDLINKNISALPKH